MSTSTTPLEFNSAGEGWHLRPRRLLWLRIAALLVGLAGIGLGGWLVTRGVVGIGFVVALVAVALALLTLGRGHRAEQAPSIVDAPEGRGLLVPVRAEPLTALAAFTILAVVVLALPVVLLTSPSDPGTGGLASLLATVATVVVLVGLGLLFATAAVRALLTRTARERGILLMPDVVVLRAQPRPVWFPWDDVLAVRAHWTRARGIGDSWASPDDLVSNWLTFEVREGAASGRSRLAVVSRQPHPTVDVRLVASDALTVLELCRYYAEHARRRDELDGPRAVQRALSLRHSR